MRTRSTMMKAGDPLAIPDYRLRYPTFHSDGKFLRAEHLGVGDFVLGHYVGGPRYAVWNRAGNAAWQIICTAGGRGRWGEATQQRVISPRDLLLIRPGTTSDYGTADGAKRWDLYAMLFQPRPGARDLLNWPQVAPGLSHVTIGDARVWRRVLHCFRAAVDWARSPWSNRERLVANALEQALLLSHGYLFRDGDALQRPLDSRVRLAAELLTREFDEPPALEEVARRVGLSLSRLAHLFRDELHIAPRHFLERNRIEHACHMLRTTDFPVKMIAARLGFASPFYFTRRFTRATGHSPTEYRHGEGQ